MRFAVPGRGAAGALIVLCASSWVRAQQPPPPPPPPRPEATLQARVFPDPPVVERSGGLQHLDFEFRLDAVGGPVRLLNVLVRGVDKQGALVRYRQLVPTHYPANFSDAALFQGERFLGRAPFDVNGPIPAGGRVLFFNPWHSFGPDEALGALAYTFYYVDDHGRVGQATVEVKPVEAKPVVAALRLPVAGRWLLLEGHDYETHHRRIFSGVNAQRYAHDFVVLQPDGTLYKGDGTRVTDYAAYGAEVLAPAPGVVVAREGGLPDNPVGSRDDVAWAGNHVVIDHGGGLHSVLAHLSKGSVTVNVGDRVVGGQVVARAGNSGSSDLPHLHYGLQKGADLQVSRADGVVPLFAKYRRVVGKQEVAVELGSPATGELVVGEPAQQAAPRK